MVFERCIQLPVTWSHAGKKASCILEISGSDSTKRSVRAISLKQFNQPSVSVRGMFELRTLHSEHSTSVSSCRYNSHLSSHTNHLTPPRTPPISNNSSHTTRLAPLISSGVVLFVRSCFAFGVYQSRTRTTCGPQNIS